ncbi:MAG TPA: DUF1015 family protein [Candidatus Syntrophosphaera sp.]|jgi:uncharacterized protein (DUF1015 family)|nr:MAG: hypothetical protein BWY18_00651 [Candidatus Cloacimonetes bacterium ADurb.Bin211]HOD59126.1 DUF1015 family protein [Candidatus Syntrophosphaera sp.]HQM79169.1 DUF1015 family protein [Candidatus Syntrophosphaera sp.]
MATFKPFKAVRPLPEYASEIASLPYDVMDSDEARIEAQKHPLSFIRVEKPEVDLPPEIDLYDPAVYAKARENLYRYLQEGYMKQDTEPRYYVYREIMNGREQNGLVGLVSVDEYMSGVIKKHELTREDKEQDRIRHIDACNAHSSPVFLTYKHQDTINEVVERVKKSHTPEYDFVADDGISHSLWLIDSKDDIEAIQKGFEALDCLYVADGHHRTASAAKVGLLRRQQHPDYTGEEEFNFFMAVIVPDNQLKIYDYNRIVRDLNNHTVETFLHLVEDKFEVTKLSGVRVFNPTHKHEIGMYLAHSWYCLRPRFGTWEANNPVASLDVSILQNNLLNPILGIVDPRRDKRIDFVGGIRGLEELVRRVNSGREAVAFAMYPTSVDELMRIADAGEIMPPKSTWFEPKLRSGLFIHLLE